MHAHAFAGVVPGSVIDAVCVGDQWYALDMAYHWVCWVRTSTRLGWSALVDVPAPRVSGSDVAALAEWQVAARRIELVVDLRKVCEQLKEQRL